MPATSTEQGRNQMSSHSVEDIKAHSHRLRGSLLDSLAAPLSGVLREAVRLTLAAMVPND